MCWRKSFKQPINLCGNMGIILWPAELWIQGCILALSAINFLWWSPCCFSIDWWTNGSCPYSVFHFSAVIPFASLFLSILFISLMYPPLFCQDVVLLQSQGIPSPALNFKSCGASEMANIVPLLILSPGNLWQQLNKGQHSEITDKTFLVQS